jgi:hypothetical protein
MKNRSLIAIIVAVVLLCATCILFMGQYLSNGCFWWECAPERDFHVSDWEIPLSLFPKGSTTDHLNIPTDNNFGEIEGIFQEIHLDLNYRIAYYDIYRFPRVKNAILQFEHNKKDMIDRDTGEIWKEPDNLHFSSTTADNSYVACGYWSQQYRCKMTAQYQEYIIFFNANINEQMTFEHFEKVIIYLDEQISKHLYE